MQPQDPSQPQPPIDPNMVPHNPPVVGQDIAQPAAQPVAPISQQPPTLPAQPVSSTSPSPQPQALVMPSVSPQQSVQPAVAQPVISPDPNLQPTQADMQQSSPVYTPSVDPLPVPPPKHAGSRKMQIISLSVLLIVLVFSMSGGFFLFDRSRSSSDDATVSESTDITDSQSAVDSTPATPAESSATTGVSEKTINKTITDEALGTTIKVSKVRRNVTFNSDLSNLGKSQTSFAVEVTVTAGEKYGSTISGSNFKLLTGSKTTYESDVPFTEYIAKEKLTVFETPTRGKSATGWLFYYVSNEQAGDAALRYTRAEAKVLGGSGSTVAAKQADVAL